MKIEEKFNKRSADLVTVQTPTVQSSSGFALGIRLQFFPEARDDQRMLSMHLTPAEALDLADYLIGAARERLHSDPASLHGNVVKA